MIKDYSNCPCQTIGEVEYDRLIEEFEKIRNQCPALNQFFIPNEEILNNLTQFDRTPNEAHHRPFLTMALEGGYLKEITSPIHKYLLEGENFSARVTNDYKNRFKETWVSKSSSIKRHKTLKKQIGSFFELLYAKHLEENGFEVFCLEAWGDKSDITSKFRGEKYEIEVKYIGQEDDDFCALVEGLNNQSGVWISQPDPKVFHNYLVTRIYEGAKQLDRLTSNNKRRVAVIIDCMGFCPHPFWDPCKNSNFNLWSGRILHVQSPKWLKHFNEVFLKENPNADTPAKRRELISKLDAIIILESAQFKLNEKYNLPNPSRS